jgi:hypothetical protein
MNALGLKHHEDEFELKKHLTFAQSEIAQLRRTLEGQSEDLRTRISGALGRLGFIRTRLIREGNLGHGHTEDVEAIAEEAEQGLRELQSWIFNQRRYDELLARLSTHAGIVPRTYADVTERTQKLLEYYDAMSQRLREILVYATAG